jgi:CheY-like chemotaxis protein
MSAIAPNEQELKTFGAAFVTHLAEAIASLCGIELKPLESISDKEFLISAKVQSDLPCLAMISFSGGICGDYIIGCDPEEWRPVFTDFVSESDPFESLFVGFIKESLNMAVGHAINALRDKYPNLTFISPKVIYGHLDYPETYVVSFRIGADVIHRFEGHLAINTMQHEMETTLQKEQQEKSEALVRAKMMKEVADRLEAEVTLRTRDLRIAKERTEVILKSLTEILFTVNRNLQISGESSDSAKQFFPSSLEGANVLDLLYPPGNPSLQLERRRMADFLESAFELLIPQQFASMLPQAPINLTYIKAAEHGKVFRFTMQYSPIIEEGQLEKIVISMRDNTEISELRDSLGLSYKKMVSSLEHLESLLSDEHHTTSLSAYLEDMIPLAEAVTEGLRHIDQEQIANLMRLTHTIKGGARSFKLDHIQYFAHEAESLLTKLKSGEQNLSADDYAALSEHVTMVASGLKSLKKLFAKESSPDRTLVWISCIDNLKRSTQALGYELNKNVEMEADGEYVLYGKDLSIFNRILPHMIRNSIDHGIESSAERQASSKSQQGHIAISLDLVNESWQLIYQDDGRGINRDKLLDKALRKGLISSTVEVKGLPDLLKIMCSPGFSTADQVTEISGRGVGMDAVRTLLQEAGGDLELRKADQTGTQFLMTWKVQEKTPLRQWSHTLHEEILVVDDEPEYAELMIEIVRAETKLPLLAARNGKEALDLMESRPIGLVITDIRMPTMSGWEFLALLSQQHARVPVIVMSGSSDPEMERKLSNLGVVGFLPKPVDFELLRSAVKRALNIRRKHAAEEETKRLSAAKETPKLRLSA